MSSSLSGMGPINVRPGDQSVQSAVQRTAALAVATVKASLAEEREFPSVPVPSTRGF